jgi:hypothetical protein
VTRDVPPIHGFLIHASQKGHAPASAMADTGAWILVPLPGHRREYLAHADRWSPRAEWRARTGAVEVGLSS